jgi:gas vesicle protein
MKEQYRARGGVRRTIGVFAVGTAVGSIVALLFAPASGRETRRQIRLKANALKRNADELRETASEKLAVARTWVMNHIPNGHAKRLPRRRHPANA